MKVIFLGTPQFAVPVLKELTESEKHEVIAVVTQPDKVNGRNGKTNIGKVKEYAQSVGLKVLQYSNISSDGEEELKGLKPDIMVTCAYGQILKQNILDICPIFNVHASILPQYRGSSPVQWAIINGETEVGVTIMKTELGVDTGDMIATDKMALSGNENSEEVLEALSYLGAKLIVKVLDKAVDGSLTFIKQDEKKATYCRMLKKEDGRIDFAKTADEVKNFIRGVTPWPGAFTSYMGKTLKVLKSAVSDIKAENAEIGEVVSASPKTGLVVKCQKGCIELLTVQAENSKAMDAKAYLLGHKVNVGDKFI